jgi:hypothetical protein
MTYRQMLPDPSFTQAIETLTHGSEQQQMGCTPPAGRYLPSWQDVAKGYC